LLLPRWPRRGWHEEWRTIEEGYQGRRRQFDRPLPEQQLWRTVPGSSRLLRQGQKETRLFPGYLHTSISTGRLGWFAKAFRRRIRLRAVDDVLLGRALGGFEVGPWETGEFLDGGDTESSSELDITL